MPLFNRVIALDLALTMQGTPLGAQRGSVFIILESLISVDDRIDLA